MMIKIFKLHEHYKSFHMLSPHSCLTIDFEFYFIYVHFNNEVNHLYASESL